MTADIADDVTLVTTRPQRRDPKPATKCVHKRCRRAYADHAGGECPNGRGAFKRYVPTGMRAASSFPKAEIDVLDAVLTGLMRGADLTVLARESENELVSLRRKAAVMRKRVSAKATTIGGE